MTSSASLGLFGKALPIFLLFSILPLTLFFFLLGKFARVSPTTRRALLLWYTRTYTTPSRHAISSMDSTSRTDTLSVRIAAAAATDDDGGSWFEVDG